MGRVDVRDRRLVAIEHDVPIPTIEPAPKAFLTWLRSSQPVSLVLLFVLLLYRWQAVIAIQRFLMALVFGAAGVLALDHAALTMDVGLPDLSWILTVSALICAGWRTACVLDQVVEDKIRGIAAGIMTAILFGSIDGPLNSILSLAVAVLVPMLSPRIALGFVVSLCLSAALQLPPSVDVAAATVALVIAGLDRWRGLPPKTGTSKTNQ
jgi:hypothetical protein